MKSIAYQVLNKATEEGDTVDIALAVQAHDLDFEPAFVVLDSDSGSLTMFSATGAESVGLKAVPADVVAHIIMNSGIVLFGFSATDPALGHKAFVLRLRTNS